MKDEGSAAVEIITAQLLRQGLDIARRATCWAATASPTNSAARHLVNLEVVNTYEGTTTCTP